MIFPLSLLKFCICKYFESRDPNPPLHAVWGAHWPRGENFIEFAWGQMLRIVTYMTILTMYCLNMQDMMHIYAIHDRYLQYFECRILKFLLEWKNISKNNRELHLLVHMIKTNVQNDGWNRKTKLNCSSMH